MNALRTPERVEAAVSEALDRLGDDDKLREQLSMLWGRLVADVELKAHRARVEADVRARFRVTRRDLDDRPDSDAWPGENEPHGFHLTDMPCGPYDRGPQ